MDICFWHLCAEEIKQSLNEKEHVKIYFTYSSLNSVKHIWPAFKCLNVKDVYISTNLEWQFKIEYFAFNISVLVLMLICIPCPETESKTSLSRVGFRLLILVKCSCN